MENEEQSPQEETALDDATQSPPKMTVDKNDGDQSAIPAPESSLPVPDSAPEDEKVYASALAYRITESGAKKVRITHSDYKKLYRSGLTQTREDNAPLKLDTGVLLDIATGDMASGTFIEVE